MWLEITGLFGGHSLLEMGNWVIFQIHMENFRGQGGRVLAGFWPGRVDKGSEVGWLWSGV